MLVDVVRGGTHAFRCHYGQSGEEMAVNNGGVTSNDPTNMNRGTNSLSDDPRSQDPLFPTGRYNESKILLVGACLARIHASLCYRHFIQCSIINNKIPTLLSSLYPLSSSRL